MKKISFLFKAFALLLFSILIFSFSTENKQDSRLVGVWKGFEIDKQIDGIEKHWIQQRFKDGTYVIMFTTKKDCQIETFTEKGKWWTEKGKFYELSGDAKEADVYNYEVKSEEVVEFKSINLSGKQVDTYIFSDYKLDLN